MTKFEKIQNTIHNISKDFETPEALSKHIEKEFGVGVHLDKASDYANTRIGKNSHGFEIWHLRNGNFSRCVGSINVHKNHFAK